MAGQDLAFLDTGGSCIDIAIQNGDYVADDGLETLVLVSLYTDRYVPPEELPPNVEDSRGWWGDDLLENEDDRIGSRLWVYDRIGKINLETRNGIKDACEEALAWMIEDGLAEQVVVATTLVTNTRIDISIEIFRPEGDNFALKFIWDAQELRRVG